MSIYSLGEPVVYQPPQPQTGGLNGSWAYKGCALDNVIDGTRTFYWQLEFPDILTPNMCLNQCAKFGYMAAGLEYGKECYCGDPANMAAVGATFHPDSECDIPCAGNASSICGGENRLTTYFWTGTPFYTWSFPQDPSEAGEYQYLVNSPNVPLMTMQAITGKVSFISKFGTGPAGDTGAFELDLSNLSWRTLHVLTDVFCSAGLILPDKGGRQLTVGGWSGDSTFGTRLYWPDGSAGVPGTHDW